MTPPTSTSPSAAMNAAMVHLNRRQPPRTSTPLPASPRASLALSASSVRRKMSGEHVPQVPQFPAMNSPSASSSSSTSSLPPGLRALKLAASGNGDERLFQQMQTRV
jgi:hypothetical protein